MGWREGGRAGGGGKGGKEGGREREKRRERNRRVMKNAMIINVGDRCVVLCFRRGGTFGPTSSSLAGGDAGGTRRCRNAGQVDKGIENRFDYIAAFAALAKTMCVAVLMQLIVEL